MDLHYSRCLSRSGSSTAGLRSFERQQEFMIGAFFKIMGKPTEDPLSLGCTAPTPNKTLKRTQTEEESSSLKK